MVAELNHLNLMNEVAMGERPVGMIIPELRRRRMTTWRLMLKVEKVILVLIILRRILRTRMIGGRLQNLQRHHKEWSTCFRVVEVLMSLRDLTR